MAKDNRAKVKEAEDNVRDIINWIEVWNLEEIEDNYKKIDDKTLEELKSKLEKLAKKVSGLTVAI